MKAPFSRLALLFAALPAAFFPALADDGLPAPPKSMRAALQPFVDKHTLAGAVMLVADKVLAIEEAVKQMATKQTTDALNVSQGIGWFTGPPWFTVAGEYGHGGAFSTNMIIDTKRGLVLVWMLQHADYPDDGRQSQEVFRRVAGERFTGAR